MTRLLNAWRALEPEQRIAAFAALALLVTMFFPWYGLQSLNRKTGAIYSHSISAFGDVSFVEAAIFLVAAGVGAMLLARAEGREFQLPGGDGTIVLLAGGWAALLIFYRVFSRPAGDGYPVGIEWGFFLAFVAAGFLAYAGWRIRGAERPEPPLRRSRPLGGDGGRGRGHPRAPARGPARPPVQADPDRAPAQADPDRPVAATRGPLGERPRRVAPVPAREPFPPPPPPASEQLSFEEQPATGRRPTDRGRDAPSSS